MPFLFVTTQINSQTLSPNDTQALLYLLIVNYNDKPVIENISVQSLQTKKNYNVTSNKNGIAEILIPINDRYVLNLSDYPNFDILEIPNKPYYQLNYKVEIPQLSNKECTLSLEVTNLNNDKMINEEVVIINQESQIKQTKITDNNGFAVFNVTSGSSYILEFKNAPDYDLINIPKIDNGIYVYKSKFEGSKYKLHPSRLKALINLYYYNIDSIPLSNEEFTIKSLSNNKRYRSITDKNGLSQILVPNGDEYSVSTSSRNDIIKLKIPNDVRSIIEHKHYFLSSKEYKIQKTALERSAAIRDSLYNINNIKNLEESNRNRELFEKRTLDVNYYSLNEETELLKKRIEKKAIYTRQQLSVDSLFFVKTKRSILSSLYRLKDRWKEKVFVVDFTCSMDPYIDELLLWYQMNLVNGEQKQYLFFNDGDNIIKVEDKIIGKTGGFHYVLKNTIENIHDTLRVTRSLSPLCSIDLPENDIEALIDAQKQLKKGTELILIADNYSPVRDIELVDQVVHPVRVIVCGVVDKINDDLLEIALKTKGSIHTIEEDIMNLSNLKDGDEIIINRNIYKFMDGRLFWVRCVVDNIPKMY